MGVNLRQAVHFLIQQGFYEALSAMCQALCYMLVTRRCAIDALLFLMELRVWCGRHVLNNHTNNHTILLMINAIEEICRTP